MKIEVNQILKVFSAYSRNIVDEAIEAWKSGIEPIVSGRVTNTPLAQNYNDLTDDAKEFIAEESRSASGIMPFCKCGKQLNLTGVCSGCKKGKEGWKSKLICLNPECRYEEFFREDVQEKFEELKKASNVL